MMYIILPLIAHILGDFTFQGDSLSNKKKKGKKAFFLHCGVYTLCIFSGVLFFSSTIITLFKITLIIGISHAVIDYGKIVLEEKVLSNRKGNSFQPVFIFLLDQMLHILIITIVTYKLTSVNPLGVFFETSLHKYMGTIDMEKGIILIFIFLLSASPTAILIKKILEAFKISTIESDSSNSTEKVKNGYYIGVLERLVIIGLGLQGQLGAIGLVIAAKSLVRFKQFGEDNNFAEKYLIGTLLSVVFALSYVALGKYLLNMV